MAATDKTYKVYKHTTPSGKVYIGITCDTLQHRWRGGHGYKTNQHFARAIQKYGWPNIQHEVIAEGLTKEEAEKMEVELIEQYGSTDPAKGYNRSPGGNTVAPETARKISAALTGVPLSPERRQRLSEQRKGRKLSEERKKALSDSHKRNPKIQEHIRALNKARAGVPKAEGQRRKIAENQPRRRQVVNLSTGETYASLQAAAAACGGNHANISAACSGRRQKAYGSRWAYKEVAAK